MASLIDVSDIRIIVLYNGGQEVAILNQGYQREPGALVFQNFFLDVVKGEMTLEDTFLESENSDLKFLESLSRVTIVIFGLCSNGAAREGFLMHDIKTFTEAAPDEDDPEAGATHPGYSDYYLRCWGGYRELSESELWRGSRFSATEV